MISVLILTKNEEINIKECIRSVSWSDDIFVLDSHSTDRTADFAMESNAYVVKRSFDNYASQRTFGLSLSFKYEWVLMLDADERSTPELAAEIMNTLGNVGKEITLFRMRRKDHFLNRWIKRSSGYPTWFGRLFRRGSLSITREINEEFHTSGKVGFLQNHINHYPFAKGISFWFERHNTYSSMEAKLHSQRNLSRPPLKSIFRSDPAIRRAGLKSVLYELPMRPTIVFVYLYFFRLGFMDGQAGYYYCRMRAAYELMIDAKALEFTCKNDTSLP